MNNPYAFNEMFKQHFDFNQIFATQRRNLEALSAANQAVVEGAQAISRRQAELVRDNVEATLRASRELLTGGTPDASLSRQAEFARQWFESALSNVREVSEMAAKTGFEAFDRINQRISENLEELGKASGQSTRAKKNAA